MKSLFLTASLLICVSFLQAVPFTLHNSTLQSIPLIIPGVMNPNLSPLSNSGVDLQVGQKIFFKVRGRRYLLLEVTEDLRDVKLDVGSLLKERKRELGV